MDGVSYFRIHRFLKLPTSRSVPRAVRGDPDVPGLNSEDSERLEDAHIPLLGKSRCRLLPALRAADVRHFLLSNPLEAAESRPPACWFARAWGGGSRIWKMEVSKVIAHFR